MTNGRALLDLARALAHVKHEGQCRKGTGEPYIEHVERVAAAVQGWRRKTIAYLHDLVEDTDITLFDLKKLGFTNDIVQAVDALSRKEGETYREFIERACNAYAGHRPDVIAVKLADVRDNLRDLDILPGDRDSMRSRYITAEAILVDYDSSV